ncbi:MAG: hypothetical protein CMH30_09170 [Micavibrio sp.]|nr:hypothetical protein [Micavibrio sp.]
MADTSTTAPTTEAKMETATTANQNTQNPTVAETASTAAKAPAKKATAQTKKAVKTAKKTRSKAKKVAKKATKATKKLVNKTTSTIGKATTMSTKATQKQFDDFTQQAQEGFEQFSAFGKNFFEALIQSTTIASSGTQDLVKESMSASQQATEDAVNALKQMMTCRSLNELTEKQNAFAQESMNSSVKTATEMTEKYIQLCTKAAEPITKQVTSTVEKAQKRAA